ncbi:type II toxin-antitoxin system RelE/ParE family toxin, partial [Escherichia coli]|uniref:type II toxin-antitoxin system RelE family toxin n=1 Tax=Escherichia coli TaxID=562 RepID=UPI00375437CB
MTYELAFDRRALKEWQKLGHTIREQFKKKLAERLENPRVPAARLHGGTVAKLAMRQPFVLFKGLTFQKLCLP